MFQASSNLSALIENADKEKNTESPKEEAGLPTSSSPKQIRRVHPDLINDSDEEEDQNETSARSVHVPEQHCDAVNKLQSTEVSASISKDLIDVADSQNDLQPCDKSSD